MLFIIEVLIAALVNDSFIRPFFGDVLVVILIYFFVRLFTNIKHVYAVPGVFIFSCFVEISQYFNLLSHLNLQDNKFAGIIMGTTFNAMDFPAYFLGTLIILAPPIMMRFHKRKSKITSTR